MAVRSSRNRFASGDDNFNPCLQCGRRELLATARNFVCDFPRRSANHLGNSNSFAISFLSRHTHPVRQTLSLEENEIEVAAHTAEPDERMALLQQVIASLPPLDRGLLLLYLDDHSYRDIAAILGLSETNVATKLNRLKQRVREETLQPHRQNS